MLVLSDANLVYLAVPKTGSTSVEAALGPHADISFSHARKHITARRYKNRVAPFLRDLLGRQPETVAVMRAPLDQLRSWYRYRARPAMQGSATSTLGISFDDFVRAVIRPDPPPYAAIGSQHSFLSGGRGRLLVDHLFAHDAPDTLCRFLSTRLGAPIELPRMNVSPDLPAPISDAVLADLQAARAAEFALFDRLSAAGGYLGDAGLPPCLSSAPVRPAQTAQNPAF